MSGELPLELLMLLCDQGKYEEAEALVDRHVARIDWETARASERPKGER